MISLIITTLDYSEGLWFTIQHNRIELENSGLDWEMIIVDGGSSKSELDWVKKIIGNFSKWGVPIRLVECPIHYGCAGTRTAGLLEAKGDIAFVMDGHVLVARDHFKKQIEVLSQPDVIIAYSPMAYNYETFYEYSLNQIYFKTTNAPYSPTSPEPYPIIGANNSSFAVRRKELLSIFLPEEELKDIPYTMDEPSFPMRAWMFGYKVMMNPHTWHAHSYFRHSDRGNFNFEYAKPKSAYALSGKELSDKVAKEWASTHNPNAKIILPEKDREFVEKNAKVKYDDLMAYVKEQGIKV